MWALVKREWYVYFSSPLGYLILGLFLTLSTLFLWFLDTEYNLLNAGFADLNAFFVLGPWLLLILIPKTPSEITSMPPPVCAATFVAR